MNRKDTENPREKVYCVVDKERFEKIKKGAYCFLKLVALAFLFAIFANLISSCRKDGKVQIYEVKTSGVMYQTSADNKRLKEPVSTETVYFVVEGEKEWK